MITPNLNKIYEQLTSKQKAILSLNQITHAVTHDGLDNDERVREYERIEATVPRRHYSALDDEFTRWRANTELMAYRWSTFYGERYSLYLKWKLTVLSVTFLRSEGDPCADFPTMAKMWDIHTRLETQLHALDVALDTICDQHGINHHDLRALVLTARFIPDEPTTPDPDTLAIQLRSMNGCLQRGAQPDK